jgi:ribosomal protein S18 acetylase RimI-like enzyme
VTTGEPDVLFLRQMGYEAAAWRPEHPRPAFDAVFSNPKISGYTDDWGRAGDYGVIAEAGDGTPIGAAWYRLFPADAPGYGFVSPAIPEVSIGVSPASRGQRVGTSLLAALIEHARQSALPALSLSVEEDNPAVRLYERFGFTRVGRVENAWTMRLDFDGGAADD